MLSQKLSLIILVSLAVIAVVFIVLFIASVVKKKKLVVKVHDLTNEIKLKDLSIDELKTDKNSMSLDIKNLKSEIDKRIEEVKDCTDKYNKLNASVYKITDAIPEKVKEGFDINKKKHFMTCWMKLQNEAYELGALTVEHNNIVLRVRKK